VRRPSGIELALWKRAIGGARYVKERPQFALNEALLRKRTRRYTIRRTDRQLTIRHPLVDAYIVTEVLGGSYDIPREVVDALSSVHPLRIGELGGHIGSATLALIDQFPEATVTVFEPHPDNVRLLRDTVKANHLDEQVTIHAKAAGTAAGQMVMDGYSALVHYVRDEDEVIDDMPFFRSVLGPTTPVTVEVVDVFPTLAGCDLLKIDIEGGEWPILADPRFASLPARAITMEYHGWGAPSPDSARSATELLNRAGFQVGEPFDVRGDTGVPWAWKPAPTAT
jgi:FkbM family methyltransferase